MLNLTSPQSHGGAAAILGELPAHILDLSVNLNPYGPPPGLAEELLQVPWREYPDPHTKKLRQALALRRDWDPETVVFGNGANELIWAAVRVLLKAGDSCVCIEPVYSEFSRAARVQGALVNALRTSPEDQFRTKLSTLSDHCLSTEAKVVYLCNPQSPTGTLYAQAELSTWAEQHPAITLILDESFLSLSEAYREAHRRYPKNVLRLVSLTKDFALAGLRLGYAHGELPLIEALRAVLPTWSVNAFAQAAGLYCLEREDFLEESRQRIFQDKQNFMNALKQRDLEPLPSQSIFVMLKVPNAETLAGQLWERYQILVRSCASYGFPDWWRLAVRPDEEQARFFQVLDQELGL